MSEHIPYISYPYSKSHPRHLYSIARLFDLQPKHYGKARILEIGGGAGGNILPLAFHYPEAEIMGVDIDKEATQEAIYHAKALGLENISFEACNIEKFVPEGQYDYILAHGIYSWVRPQARQAILRLCEHHLAPQGIAYISYNTYPGWHALEGLRGMMRYHAKAFEGAHQQVDQARAMLDFMAQSVGEENPSYQEFIARERQLIEQHPDCYVYDEFLGEHCQPFYFHQFMQDAAKHNLGYMGDAALDTMFIGHLNESAQQVLQSLGRDLIRTEQFIDFITNRRFRMSLLCKKDVEVKRNLSPERLDGMYVTLAIRQGEGEANWDDGVHFVSAGRTKMSSQDPLVIAMMKRLSAAKGKAVEIDVLAKAVQQELGQEGGEVIWTVKEQLLHLLVAGVVTVQDEPSSFVTEHQANAKICPLAAYQAQQGDWVTNRKHEKQPLDHVLLEAIEDPTKLTSSHHPAFSQFLVGI